MKVTKLEKEEFTKQINETLVNQSNISLYCIYDNKYVLRGNSLPPNENAIKEHHLDDIEIPSMGGSIVVCPGDIHFGAILNSIEEMNTFIAAVQNNLRELIKKHNLESTIDNNDVLINDYKVTSCFSRMVGKVCLGGFHISVNVDLDLIKQVCTKPMVKTPKGLSEFGITTEEIEQEVVLKTAQDLENFMLN